MKEFRILNGIECPKDIKNLSQAELAELSAEIRELITETVLKNGGHLGSNLGVVELTLALHRVFDFEKDHLIFDVGHQCYTHKIITGRKKDFSALRQRGGISGFTKRSESPYDCFGCGHSSTSVSAAIGFAEADVLKSNNAYTVAVLGDGAFTGGMIHEALNNCRKDLRLIIVLNENEMSISKNTGAFAGLISKIRISRGYYKSKERTAKLLHKIPVVGTKLFASLRRTKQYFKSKIYKSNYFEELGLNYLGPADGNNIEVMERLLEEAKNSSKSTIIHIKTVKGKGYAPAEEHPGRYHSVSPNGTVLEKNYSTEAGEILTEIGKHNDKVCAVTAAMADGTGLIPFKKALPERFFDVGIAEEHAMTFCAGLAASGYRPYFAVYSSFLQRAYDNVIHDIALQKLPVTVLVDRAGISASDGATHHGIFDVSFLNAIPSVEIFTPSDFSSLKNAMEYSQNANAPVFIRYSNSPELKDREKLFPYGNGFCRCNFDVGSKPEKIIITYGRIVSEAVCAQKEIESCGIVLLERLTPYEKIATLISMLAENAKKVVFLEEGIKNGGAGMTVGSLIKLPKDCEYRLLAIDGVFDTDRNSGNIYSDFGIGKEEIIRALF